MLPNAQVFMLFTGAIMLVLAGATIALTQRARLDPKLAAYLTGSFCGVPILVANFVQHVGFAEESGSVLGWVLQCALCWIFAWLPFGGLGLILYLALRRFFPRFRFATSATEEKGKTIFALVFMTVISAAGWVLGLAFR